MTKLKVKSKEEYQAYLNSRKWEETRRRIFKRDGYRCCICGTAKNLCCHHITYENIGHEKDSDLVTLCNSCHETIHQGNDYHEYLCIAWDRLHDRLEVAKTEQEKELIQKQLDILDKATSEIVKVGTENVTSL